ncbi:MAG: hypothetical protein ACQET7_14200, partial [Thermodesulfobacteriota bacterium]
MSVQFGFFGIEIAIGIEIDFLQSIDPGVFLHTGVDIKLFVSKYHFILFRLRSRSRFRSRFRSRSRF